MDEIETAATEQTAADSSPRRSAVKKSGWALWFCLGLMVLITTLAHFLIQPPEPVAGNVPQDQFSVSRAEFFLEQLVADGIPHPAGSEQNRLVRMKIVSRLKSFGYSVTLQETESEIHRRRLEADPNRLPICNVMTRLEGITDDPAIMLVTHFDSVPYGPGASDDGVGVAAMLEVARMLKQKGPPRRTVLFLFTDGEEYGLLGAKKFVEQHPWAKRVKWVINLEARGTDGPSVMFETGTESLSSIREFASVSRRPVSSSLFFEIYKRLPNDTDFSVFKKAGMQGFNFAFIGNVKNYHTPQDNLVNVDRSSFQHHGENMWRLVADLAYRDEMPEVGGQAVYFDVLARLLVWWPVSWSLWLTSFGGVVWVAIGWRNWKRERSSGLSLAVASGWLLLLFFAVLLMGWICNLAWSLEGRLDNAWPESPLPILTSFWLLGVVTSAGLRLGFQGQLNAFSQWWVVWGAWMLLAAATSVFLAGASYLFIVPFVIAVLSHAVLRDLFQCSIDVVSLFAIVATCVLWLPLELLFYDAVGLRLNTVLIGRVAFVMTVVWPLFVGAPTKVVWWVMGVSSFALLLFLTAGVVANPTV